MDPFLELLAAWWWTAPATVGLGAISYTALTSRKRRQKRLAVDAARLAEQKAMRSLISARALIRTAQADLLTAQANKVSRAPGVPSVADAQRSLQRAKDAQKAATLNLKASRTHVRAERAALGAGASDEDLPLAQTMRTHDTITAQWLEYETDASAAIAFPQMSDARHPMTAAFLEAQHRAVWLRPESASAKISAADYLAYRDAVRALDAAFAAAEEAALRAAAPPPPPPQPTATENAARAAGRAAGKAAAWGTATWKEWRGR